MRILLILFIGVVYANAQLDPWYEASLSKYETSYRWDNVEKKSHSHLSFIRKSGIDYVVLKPGQSILVPLAPWGMLRCESKEKLDEHSVDFSYSNGSSLYVESTNFIFQKNHSTVFSPKVPHSSLVRVRRPSSKDTPISLALFTLRNTPTPQINEYRNLLEVNAPHFNIESQRGRFRKKFWGLLPQQKIDLVIKGPKRIQIQTRIPFSTHESRTFQSYYMQAEVDKKIFPLYFETSPESTRRMLVNGCSKVLGKERESYLEIPLGTHKVVLSASNPLYFRILCQDNNYFFPQLNSTEVSQAMPSLLQKSLWDINNLEKFSKLKYRHLLGTEAERVALRLIRDNSFRDGAMLATSIMRDFAYEHRNYPKITEISGQIQNFHTFYRSILPVQKNTKGKQEVLLFHQKRILPPGKIIRELAFSQQHYDSLINKFSRGHFLEVPTQKEKAHCYYLPKRDFPSTLRVVIPQSFSQEFIVQFDDSEPFVFDTEQISETPFHYLPSQAQVGLAISKSNQGTLGTQRGIRSINVSSIELPLSSDIRKIYVWGKSCENKNKLGKIALQYRASKPYQFSEMEYLGVINNFSSSVVYNHFCDFLQNKYIPTNEASHELSNHWLPIKRHFQAHKNIFISSLAPPIERKYKKLQNISKHHRELELNMREQNWLAVLKNCKLLSECDIEKYSYMADFSRVKALWNLGEEFLALNYLRGLFLYSENSENSQNSENSENSQNSQNSQKNKVREKALLQLRKIYTKHQNLEALEALLSVEVLRNPSLQNIRSLLEVLYKNNRYSMVLSIGLALPKQEQPVEILIRCSYHLRWWWHFEALLKRLPLAEQNYWFAMQSIYWGEADKSLILFKKAGKKGQVWGDYLEQLKVLEKNLQHHSMAVRAQAILDWENIIKKYPGRYVWEQKQDIIKDYQGTKVTYSINRDIYGIGYTGNLAKPIKIKVLGPLRVKFEMRPVYHEKTEHAQDFWGCIILNGEKKYIPFLNNTINSGLQLSDSQSFLGRKAVHEISLGGGLHEITVYGEGQSLWTRVFVTRPEFSMGVLPPFQRETALMFLHDSHKNSYISSIVPVYLFKKNSSFEEILLQAPESQAPKKTVILPNNKNLWTRIALRLGFPLKDYQKQLENIVYSSSYSLPEKVLAWNKLIEIDKNFIHRPPAKVSSAVLEGVYTQHQFWEKIQDLPAPQNALDIYQRMSSFLKISQKGNEVEKLQAKAHLLYEQNKKMPGLRTLYLRILRNSKWELINNIHDSAGIHPVEISGYSPESDHMKVRSALLTNFTAKEQLFSANKTIDLSLNNLQATQIQMVIRRPAISYIRQYPLKLLYYLDNKKYTLLIPAETTQKNISISLSKGEHYLSLRLQQPLASQFLSVEFYELTPLQKSNIVKQVKRNYHLATHEKPVQCYVKGPTWLRIDGVETANSSNTHSTYKFFGLGWHLVSLLPLSQHKQTLFRIFRREHQEQEVPLVNPGISENNPVPSPLSKLKIYSDYVNYLEIHDFYSLGGQEDGTWSLNLSFNRQNVFDDQEREARHFFEWNLTHNYYDPFSRSYFESSGLVRFHEEGGPTLGFEENISHRLYWFPLTVSFSAKAFAQWIDGENFIPKGDPEFSFFTELAFIDHENLSEKLEHSRSLAIFVRYLTLKNSKGFNVAEIDQDVFTNFKAQHLAGWRYSETLTYKPWLDVQYWIKASVNSNENFITLDRVSAEIGTRKLLKFTALQLQYRLTAFLPDNDRDELSIRNSLELELRHDIWLTNQNRLEVGGDFRYDIEDTEFSGTIFISWHFGYGRGYSDFRPVRLPFKDLQTRSLQEKKFTGNNYIGSY